MSFSATRLTSFALLSSLEQDLRSNISRFLVDDEYVATLGATQTLRAQQRRSRDLGADAPSSLLALLPYLDFADSHEVLLSNLNRLPIDLAQQLQAAKQHLPRVTAARNRVAHARPMEIDDLSTVLDMSETLTGAVGVDYWEETRSTLARLRDDSSFVLGLTINLPVIPERGIYHNLPVPDFDETGFFGRKAQVAHVKRVIKGPYPAVSVLGDGGIGKTSVALKVAYDLLDDPKVEFDAIVWVSAKATVLSSSEIRRVSDAIEDSLGLFKRAAVELGGKGAGEDPVAELLAYLENFRVLLILDNLETVLDRRLRDFLLDLPNGSKVLLTSRIGAGVENPVQLEPLAEDDAHNLLRAVARIRNVALINEMSNDRIRSFSSKMSGHPLYIKWFVSGVQAGSRPEELLGDNSLLLEFCMSNVYNFLGADAQLVLGCMQVLPGEKRQAEIAFLAGLDAQRAQAAILQLMTTNFIHMEGQARGLDAETTYQLSEFARTYLDQQHSVAHSRRMKTLDRQSEMRDMGWRLQAEYTASPFDPTTIYIRDPGDYGTARMLREAVTALNSGAFENALAQCREAQLLSPMYSEAFRVEGMVQARMHNVGAAINAYERAIELDPDSAALNFHVGSFFAEEKLNSEAAVRHLQRAAQLDSDNVEILSGLSWALLIAQRFEDSATTAARAIMIGGDQRLVGPTFVIGLRGYCFALNGLVDKGSLYDALENLELASEYIGLARDEFLYGEPADRLLQLRAVASQLEGLLDEEDEYRIQKTGEFVSSIEVRLASLGLDVAERQLGRVETLLQEKAYGFISPSDGRTGRRGDDYFFHLRDVADSEWQYLALHEVVAFTPSQLDPRGRKRAANVRWLPSA